MLTVSYRTEGVTEGHTCANCDFMPTVYTTIEQTVPANAYMIVSGVADFPAHIGYMISESNETPLPCGLLLAPCIIAADKETNFVLVEVQNFSSKPVAIPSKAILCKLHRVTTVCLLSKAKSLSDDVPAVEFLNLFDLADTEANLAPSEVCQLNNLLVRWENVF